MGSESIFKILQANKRAWIGKRPLTNTNKPLEMVNRVSKVLKMYLFYLLPTMWDTFDCITRVLYVTLLMYSKTQRLRIKAFASPQQHDGVRSSFIFICSILYMTKRKETWSNSMFSKFGIYSPDFGPCNFKNLVCVRYRVDYDICVRLSCVNKVKIVIFLGHSLCILKINE